MTANRRSAYWGILSLALLLTVGCSVAREVTVVSHSEEMPMVEELILEKVDGGSLSSSAVGSDLPPLQEVVAPSVMPVIKPIPIPPPVALPSTKNVVGQEIFTQSATDTTLPWTLQDVFFDYDQMAIRQDAIPILEQNAKVLLKRYPNREVLVQGHCDERGTEAYNLILGERRASSVKNYLVNLGVETSRIRVLSLGKSQPFCLERTLPCFGQNRRAHFVLR